MKREIPQVVSDVNVFINGQGYLGIAKKLTLPKIEQELIEVKGAVQSKHSTGSIKPLEIEFTIGKVDKNQITAIGLNTFTNKVPFIFKTSLFADGKAVAIVASITGDFETYEIKELEGAKEVEVTIKLAVHFYSLTIGGTPLVLIDTRNMLCTIGGVDYLAQLRTNLI